MIIKRCPICRIVKPLTKHSKIGGHRPPFERICRSCHDEIHGIYHNRKTNKQKGNPKFHKGTRRK